MVYLLRKKKGFNSILLWLLVFVPIITLGIEAVLYRRVYACDNKSCNCVMEAQQHEKGIHQHKEYQSITNPVKATGSSLFRGMELFDKNCALCHGKSGNGDGGAGKSLNPKPSNLTDHQWKHGSSDGEIFNVIRNGIKGTGMSAWGGTLTDDDIWNLVNYIRILSQKCIFICPMHPDVKQDKPGKCPKCGMYLEKEMSGEREKNTEKENKEENKIKMEHKHHH